MNFTKIFSAQNLYFSIHCKVLSLPGVPEPGEGVVPAGEEGGVTEPGQVQHPRSVPELRAHVEHVCPRGEVIQPQRTRATCAGRAHSEQPGGAGRQTPHPVMVMRAGPCV